MKEYQDIFNRWSLVRTEDLRMLDDAGARVELAMRTDDPVDIKRALNLMDVGTYNVISAIPLLQKGENFAENVKSFEPNLIPALTIGMNLNVFNDSDVLLFAISKLLPVASGALEKLLKTLRLLQTKVIKRNSPSYLSLLKYHYSDLAITYLNYKWYNNYCNTNTLVLLQSNYLSNLFMKDEKFTDFEKEEILHVFRDHDRVYSDVQWTAKLVCSDVTNEDNWKWLYSLVKENKIAYNPIMVRPVTVPDEERFKMLTFDEKCLSMDNCLLRAVNKDAIIRIIYRVDFAEYLDTFPRNLPKELYVNAVDIGFLTIDQLSPSNRKECLQGLETRKAYEYWVSHPEVKDNVRIHSYYYYESIYRSFLTTEENQQLVSHYLDTNYNQSPEAFLKALNNLLCDDKILSLYSKELIDGIVLCLTETLINADNFYRYKTMLRKNLTKEAYDKYVTEMESANELKRKQRQLEYVESLKKGLIENLAQATSYRDFLEVVNEYADDWQYGDVDVILSSFEYLQQNTVEWEKDEEYVRLNMLYEEHGLIDFKDLCKITTSVGIGIDEGGTENE